MFSHGTIRRLTTLVVLGAAGLGASSALAVEAAKSAAQQPAEQSADAAATDADGAAAKPKAEKKVRFKKSKQVDFSNQTVEGKLQRPEASLVTASEGVTDNGLLRLREDFIDKFTAFAGEEIEQ